MKEKKVTKKAIFASLLSVAVCTSMLIGTSYAWFTDSVTSSGNIIKSGTLDIDFQVYENGEYKTVNGAIFGSDILWEPGYVAWKNVQVKNNGTLALKYTLKVDGVALDNKLAEVIDVYYAPAEMVQPNERPDFANYADYYKGTLSDFLGEEDVDIKGNLLPGAVEQATLVLKMQEGAGNEYQNQTIGEFSLSIVATQDTVEEDTFNNQYDKDAEYPVVGQTAFGAVLTDAQAGDVIPVAAGEYTLPSTVPAGVTIEGDEGTTIDTANISGTNTGALNGVTVKDVNFTSSNANGWDGMISHKTTLTDTTFDGCTFNAQADGNRDNAIYGGTASGKTVFENCTIAADVYGVNFSYVNGTLIFRNCDITGWNSFGGAKVAGDPSKVIFENCRFHHSGSYGTLRFYQDAEVTNCTFDGNFQWVDCNADNCTIELTGCTGITSAKIFNNGAHTNTWILNGETLTGVASH